MAECQEGEEEEEEEEEEEDSPLTLRVGSAGELFLSDPDAQGFVENDGDILPIPNSDDAISLALHHLQGVQKQGISNFIGLYPKNKSDSQGSQNVIGVFKPRNGAKPQRAVNGMRPNKFNVAWSRKLNGTRTETYGEYQKMVDPAAKSPKSSTTTFRD